MSFKHVIKQQKYHYVYIIVDLNNNKKYIGSRSCSIHPVDDLGKKYFSSSSNKEFIKNQKKYPNRFKYKIIDIMPSRKSAIELEISLHEWFKVDVNSEYYNKAKQTSKKFSTQGIKFSKERNLKISKRMTGEKNPNWGGLKAETIQKLKGQKRTLKSKQKASKSQIQRVQETQVCCIYCKKQGAYDNLKPYHFDKCKERLYQKYPIINIYKKVIKHKKRKISRQKKSEMFKGAENPFYGKTHTLQTKTHISNLKTLDIFKGIIVIYSNTHKIVYIGTNLNHMIRKYNLPVSAFKKALKENKTVYEDIKSNSRISWLTNKGLWKYRGWYCINYKDWYC